MRIVIEANLLSRALSVTEDRDLLSLFLAGQQGHHSVDVSPEDSPDLKRWLSGLGERTKFLCETTLKRGLKERQRRRRFTIRVADVKTPKWPDRRLPLDVAVKIAAQPLTLLLRSFGSRPSVRGISPVGYIHPESHPEELVALPARSLARVAAIRKAQPRP